MLSSLSFLVAVAGVAGGTSQSFENTNPFVQDPFVAHSLTTQLDNSTRPSAVISGVFLLPSISGTGSTRIPPGWSFSIGFQPDTFNSSSYLPQDLYIWASLPSFQPLPDWLNFDNYTITFSGVTPKHMSPDPFLITIYCAPMFGISTNAAESSFWLRVSNHSLEVVGALPAVYTTVRDDVSTQLLPDITQIIYQDPGGDYQVEPDLNGATWLEWDKSTYTLSGTIPDTFANGASVSIPINIRDHFSSTTNATLPIEILPFPFVDFALPNFSLKRGNCFNISIISFVREPKRNAFLVDWRPRLPWIYVESDELLVHGFVPHDLALNEGVAFVITATDIGTNVTSSVTFSLFLAEGPPIHSNSSSIFSMMKRSVIAAAVLLPIFAMILAGVLAQRYMRSRRVRKERGNAKSGSSRRGSHNTNTGYIIDAGERSMPRASFAGVASLAGSGSRVSEEISAEWGRLRSVSRGSTRWQRDPPRKGHISNSHSLDRQSYLPGEWGNLGELPSINFDHFFRNIQIAPDLEGAQHDLASPASTRPRSINSAYDSLPSWDSESTWQADRRRRPPSPAWRRGDLMPQRDTYTLHDFLHEEGSVWRTMQDGSPHASLSSGQTK